MNLVLTLPQLLALGTGLLVVLVASSWMLLRQDKEVRQLHTRIDMVAMPYARATPLAEQVRRKAADGSRLLAPMFKLFGYNPVRRDHYPAKAPVVLFLSLVAAVMLSQPGVMLIGPVARLGIPALWILVSRQVFAYFERRHGAILYAQFPDALAMIVRAVRVGIPVPEAVRNVGKEALEPTASEFMILADQLTIGVSLEDALRDVATRNQLQEYRFFATALSLQAQTGGGLSETLENLADVIRKRVAARKRAYALASEARTSTYVLAGLPPVTAGALSLVNPGYLDPLFTSPLGNTILGAAVGMLGFGLFAMRAIITKTLR